MVRRILIVATPKGLPW